VNQRAVSQSNHSLPACTAFTIAARQFNVNRPLQKAIAIFVTFGVALAGVIGLNPRLHVLVEHSGAAALHSHSGGRQAATEFTHAHAHSHVHQDAGKASRSRSVFFPTPALVAHAQPLTLFGLTPGDVYHAIGRVISIALTPLAATPDQSNGDHTHHSLSQLLLSGAVEGAVEIGPLIVKPERFTFFRSSPETRPVVAEWNASTATRGPPACC